ncbi:MAG: hypothetical protein JNL62_26170 [Bryobacterales bacterium]|nr:hypothetical protein [Bryobacterales bacterium]
MSRTSKVLGFSVPPAVVKEVEGLANTERLKRQQHKVGWIDALIAEVKAEEAKSPSSPSELVEEASKLARYGEQQAKKLGITTKGVNARIHAYRKARRS